MDEVEQLVRRAQQGDDKAFDTLFRRYQIRVRLYCKSLLGREEEAEEAAQESFTRAWQKIREFRFECPFHVWLLKIALNNCINLCSTMKHQASAREKSLDDPEITPSMEVRVSTAGPEKTVINRAYYEHVLQTVRLCCQSARPRWDTLDWDIFRLLYEQDIGNAAEIARLLNRPVGTIKDRIYRRITPLMTAVVKKLDAEDDFS